MADYVTFDSSFTQNGVVFFAAAGDLAAGRFFPALSKNVVTVGGTTLNVDKSGNWQSEAVWIDTGCGSSTAEPRPQFQDSIYKTVGQYRAGCDIAAVADPNTGVLVFDSYAYGGQSGWMVIGGTSVSCPVVAGIVNGAATSFPSSAALNQLLYSNAGSRRFHAITTGSAGRYSAASPWCFPTGLGSPNGLAALLNSTP